MKQSKQYAKFTEINKRRWHNKIKEKVKDWLSSRPAIIQRVQGVPHMYNAMVQRIIQWTAYMQFHYTGISLPASKVVLCDVWTLKRERGISARGTIANEWAETD